jgi:hypothetical protein
MKRISIRAIWTESSLRLRVPTPQSLAEQQVALYDPRDLYRYSVCGSRHPLTLSILL